MFYFLFFSASFIIIFSELWIIPSVPPAEVEMSAWCSSNRLKCHRRWHHRSQFDKHQLENINGFCAIQELATVGQIWVFCCETAADTCWTSDTNHILGRVIYNKHSRINLSRLLESLVLQFLTVTPEQLSRSLKDPYWSCERLQESGV